MNLIKKTYLRGILSKEIELLILFAVLLFSPDKTSLVYYLFTACLIIIFSLRSVFTERTLGISGFSNILVLINIIFIITSIFSNSFYDSLLLIADIIIVSSLIYILFIESLDKNKLFIYFLYLITIFSFFKILNDIFNNSIEIILFDNQIRIGIVSGIGFIISLFFWTHKKKWFYGLSLFINLIGIYLSGSKGVFIGITILSFIILFQKKKN